MVNKDAILNGLVFKPMIRSAEITDDTYEPYKPSVLEQIDDITGKIFGLGTNIPSGADLNDYTEAGVYYSSSATVTGTLANTPYKTGGFRLEVTNITTVDNLTQRITPNSGTLGCFFMRTKTTSAGFGSWFKYAGEVVTTT